MITPNARFWLSAPWVLPLLPLMYFQGKKIKKSVPSLPEAKGPEGSTGIQNGASLKLITIGESTVAGVGVPDHQSGFTGTLASTLAEALDRPIDWKVYARRGYTAGRVVKKIIPRIPEDRVDLIVVGLGGNDAFELNSPKNWGRDMAALIEALQVKFEQVPIVFMNMPPIKTFPAFTPLIKTTIGNLVNLLGDELARIVSEKEGVYYPAQEIKLEDWKDKLPQGKPLTAFFSDGVHPAPLTYQLWAREIAAFTLAQSNIIAYLNPTSGEA